MIQIDTSPPLIIASVNDHTVVIQRINGEKPVPETFKALERHPSNNIAGVLIQTGPLKPLSY